MTVWIMNDGRRFTRRTVKVGLQQDGWVILRRRKGRHGWGGLSEQQDRGGRRRLKWKLGNQDAYGGLA